MIVNETSGWESETERKKRERKRKKSESEREKRGKQHSRSDNRRIGFSPSWFSRQGKTPIRRRSDVSLTRENKMYFYSCNLVSSVRFWVYVYVSITLLRTIDKHRARWRGTGNRAIAVNGLGEPKLPKFPEIAVFLRGSLLYRSLRKVIWQISIRAGISTDWMFHGNRNPRNQACRYLI